MVGGVDVKRGDMGPMMGEGSERDTERERKRQRGLAAIRGSYGGMK